jgi:ribosomal 50S subunit-recycling heat shock protein
MNNAEIKSSWMVIENDDVSVSTITHLAKLSGLVKSYSEAKSLIKSGGLYLNNQKNN